MSTEVMVIVKPGSTATVEEFNRKTSAGCCLPGGDTAEGVWECENGKHTEIEV